MKCLTVKNPWALMIFRGKDCENRDWSTHVRGTVAIHASKSLSLREYEAAAYEIREIGAEPPTFEECVATNGKVLGTVCITDCVERSESKWFFGRYGFVLADQRLFQVPLAAKGALGFWEWGDLARAMYADRSRLL